MAGVNPSTSESSFRLGLPLRSFRDHRHLERVQLSRTRPSLVLNSRQSLGVRHRGRDSIPADGSSVG